MLRFLLAFALLFVALPAQSQWLGPTNVSVQGYSDVFVANGRAYVVVWSRQIRPSVTAWGRNQAPGRLPAELRYVGIAAFDPRPCARLTATSPSTLVTVDATYPYYPWTIQPDGWLWWYEPSSWIRIAAAPDDVITHYMTYTSHKTYTPCVPAGDPELVAMLFEVRLL